MLIPNKFNGYRRDGTRNLYIGGGVGEAALLQAMMTGAAVGGGTSIIQGKDPLQGALLGGLMGGAGAGVSSALGGGASAAGAVPGAAAAETAAILPEAISAQTLLIRGAQSDLLSIATAQQMTQRGPKAQLVEFAGVGHAPTLIAPDQVDAVANFVLAA